MLRKRAENDYYSLDWTPTLRHSSYKQFPFHAFSVCCILIIKYFFLYQVYLKRLFKNLSTVDSSKEYNGLSSPSSI